MAVETPISVTVGGANVGGSVISLRTEQDICRVAQICTIALNPNVAANFNPWDEIAISINGTPRFKGYVDDCLRGREPAEYIVRGTDVMKRALGNYYAEIAQDEENEDLCWVNPFVVEQELDAGYWVDYWLKYAGIPSSGAVETGRTVPVGLEWNFITVSDIILECLGYAGGGWTVIVGGDGVAQISKKVIGAATHNLSGTISFSRSQDDSWRRDRAVVFGDGVVGEKPDDPAGCTKTAALSSTFIGTQAVADDLAQDILDFFDEDLDIKRCLIAGDASIWLGESAAVSDPWTGYSGTGLITSIETTVDDRGFRQLVSLDEKCGFIWGWAPVPRIYLMSEEEGVWDGIISSGSHWRQINEGFPTINHYSGNAVAMESEDDTLWLAIGYLSGSHIPKGLWKRPSPHTSGSWHEITLPDPVDNAGDGLGLSSGSLQSKDLRTQGGKIYFTRYYEGDMPRIHRGWLYISDDKAEAWENYQIHQDNFGYAAIPLERKGLALTPSGDIFTGLQVKHRGSLLLSGSGYAQVPYDTHMDDVGPDFTFNIWFKSTEDNQTAVLLSKPGSYELGFDNGHPYFKVWDPVKGPQTFLNWMTPDGGSQIDPPVTGDWYRFRIDRYLESLLIVAIYAESTGHVSGFEWHTTDVYGWVNFLVADSASDLYVGSRDGSTGFFKGYIDLAELVDGSYRYWPWEDYIGKFSAFCESRVWPDQMYAYGFDETSGSICFDDKGPNQLHGTIKGDAEFSDAHTDCAEGIPKQTILRKEADGFSRVKLWLVSQYKYFHGIAVDNEGNLYGYGDFPGEGDVIKSPDRGANWTGWEFLDEGDEVEFLLPLSSGSLYAFSDDRYTWYLPAEGSWIQKTNIPRDATCGVVITEEPEHHIVIGVDSYKAIYETINGADSWDHLDDELIEDRIYDICLG